MTQQFHWEDLQPNFSLDLGEYFLSQDELIAFARQYDPQTFHVDPEKAKHSPIGCLCASGLQTTAIAQKLTVEALFSKTNLVAGMGVDKLRFHTPVLPDETLSASMFVKKALRSPSAGNRGIVIYDTVVINPRGEKACSFETTILVMCRDAVDTHHSKEGSQ